MSGRVLVVEDDQHIRQVIAEYLGLCGFEVRTADNGGEGLVAARAWRPDVVVLDLAMPVLDGYGFRREQVGDAAIAAIPVVVVTASYAAAVDLAQLGAVRVLRKPLDFDMLLTAVAEAIRRVGV